MGKKINKTFIFLILISLLTILPFFTWSPKINLNIAHAEENWGNWSPKENTSELKDFPKENTITKYSWEDENKYTLSMDNDCGFQTPLMTNGKPFMTTKINNRVFASFDKSKTYDFSTYKNGRKTRLDTNIIDANNVDKITINTHPTYSKHLDKAPKSLISYALHYEYYVYGSNTPTDTKVVYGSISRNHDASNWNKTYSQPHDLWKEYRGFYLLKIQVTANQFKDLGGANWGVNTIKPFYLSEKYFAYYYADDKSQDETRLMLKRKGKPEIDITNQLASFTDIGTSKGDLYLNEPYEIYFSKGKRDCPSNMNVYIRKLEDNTKYYDSHFDVIKWGTDEKSMDAERFYQLKCLDWGEVKYLWIYKDTTPPKVEIVDDNGDALTKKDGKVYTKNDHVTIKATDNHALRHWGWYIYEPDNDTVTWFNYKWTGSYGTKKATIDFYGATTNGESNDANEENKHVRYWVIYICDKANNFDPEQPSSYRRNNSSDYIYVYFDNEKPTIKGNFTNEKDNTIYTNNLDEISLLDNNKMLRATELKELYPNKQTTEINDTKIKLTNNSIYELTLTDFAGNKNTYKITTFIFERNNDEYKKKYGQYYTDPLFYKATLPSEFEKYSGEYIFKTYEDAFDFAYQHEQKQFVTDLGNNSWNYFVGYSRTARQIYTDKETLDKAISRHAKRFITSKPIKSLDELYKAHNNGVKCMVKKDEAYIEDYVAFLLDNKNVNDVLKVHPDERIKLQYFDGINIQTQAYIQKLGTAGVNESDWMPINNGDSFGNMLKKVGLYKTSKFTIKETDVCGNTGYFDVFFEISKPRLKAEVKTIENGEEKTEILEIDDDYAQSHVDVMRYISFRIINFEDDYDTCCMAEVIGTNNTFKTLQNDPQPILDRDQGTGGIYTIKVYDRSKNTLEFNITVAESAPSYIIRDNMSEHDPSFVLEFNPGTNNAIIQLHIYKMHYDGSTTELTEDEDIVPKEINSHNLKYVFRSGGVYKITILDAFGFLKEGTYKFNKDLPTGYLSVRENSTVNVNVSFTYDYSKYESEVFIYDDNNYIPMPIDDENLKESKDTARHIHKYEFVAQKNIPDTKFLIRLYDKKNKDLYNEYSFIMDTLPPAADVVDAQGNILDMNKLHWEYNNMFSVVCKEDDASIKYEINGYTKFYSSGKLLSEEGTYIFSVSDQAGNTYSFKMHMDMSVSYDFDKKYINNEENKFIFNKPFNLTIKESFKKCLINGSEVIKDTVHFNSDGTYIVEIEDNFKNTVVLTVTLDQIPPNATVSSELSKETVSIQWEDEEKVIAKLYKNGEYLKLIDNHTKVSDEGWYKVEVFDKAENMKELKFQIKRTIYASLSIPNHSISTKYVSFEIQNPQGYMTKEELKTEITYNGTAIETLPSYFKEPGKYVINATDLIGNTEVFTFTIIKEKMRSYTMHLHEKHTIVSVSKDGSLLDSKPTEFNQNGKYSVSIKDSLGQEYIVAFEINNTKPEIKKKRKNGALTITLTTPNPVKAKLYKNGKIIDENYSLSDIKESGKYKIDLIDDFGNTNSYSFKFTKSLNGGGIAGVVIGIAIITTITVFGLLKRFKNKKS